MRRDVTSAEFDKLRALYPEWIWYPRTYEPSGAIRITHLHSDELDEHPPITLAFMFALSELFGTGNVAVVTEATAGLMQVYAAAEIWIEVGP